MLDKLTTLGIIKSLDEIEGIGHRVVHGGEVFDDSVLITEEVLKKIEELSELAPLHNPANVTGIKAFQQVLPNVPAVAVFDTAFHQTMPESSFLYSLPYEYYENMASASTDSMELLISMSPSVQLKCLDAQLSNCV